MKEVAKVLDLKPGTVAFHKYRMMETLGVKTNARSCFEYAIKRQMRQHEMIPGFLRNEFSSVCNQENDRSRRG